MSIQFGRWNFDGGPVAPDYVEKVQKELTPYGPDGAGSYTNAGITILHRAFHTTKESRGETQPHISQSGAVITWDGRLDNRADLIRQLCDTSLSNSPDILIMAAAHERWETDCFAKLIGDWAVSIWKPSEHSLILAKDPVGIRHLYYSLDDKQATWCTILDPLVLHAGRSFPLEEKYIAGWLSFFPAAHLTPHVGIQPVPPSCFVRLRKNGQVVCKYWDFDAGKRIRYRADIE